MLGAKLGLRYERLTVLGKLAASFDLMLIFLMLCIVDGQENVLAINKLIFPTRSQAKANAWPGWLYIQTKE